MLCGDAGGVLRGGSWNNNNTNNFRATYRNRNNPNNRNNNRGFRVALPCPPLVRMACIYGCATRTKDKSAGCSRPLTRTNIKERRLYR